MALGPRSASAVLAMAGAFLLGGCGGGHDTSLPPLTIDPSLTASPPPDAVSRSADRQPGVAARAVLQRFLRGVGTSDPKVCTLVTAAYAKAAFGKATCQAWIAGSRTHLTPADRTALKAATVPTATRSGPAAFTVAYSDIIWSGPTTPTQRGPLRPRFTLRKLTGHWRLAI